MCALHRSHPGKHGYQGRQRDGPGAGGQRSRQALTEHRVPCGGLRPGQRQQQRELLQQAAAFGVPARVIGETGGNLLRVSVAGRLAIDVPVAELERVWSSAIEQHFAQRVA